MNTLQTYLLDHGAIDSADCTIAAHLCEKKKISWLNLIAAKAFRHGHTAIPKDSFLLKNLIKEIFITPYPTFEELQDDAIDAIFTSLQSTLTSHELPVWPTPHLDLLHKCGLSDNSLHNPYLPLPFSLCHEDRLASHLIRLSEVSLSAKWVIYEQVQNDIELICKKLNQDQRKAVMETLNHAISIICGGPGTGKTHTAGSIIALLGARYNKKKPLNFVQAQQERGPYRVLICAPTGKAVYTLHKSIKKAVQIYSQELGICEDIFHIEIKTLHKYLHDQTTLKNSSTYHTIIIDECSMIDTKMFADIFQSIHTGTRIILLGDPHQLPSIQPGQPFYDIIEACRSMCGFSVQTLNQCVRTESQDILSLAHAVLHGEARFEETFQKYFSSQSPSHQELSFLNIETIEGQNATAELISQQIVTPWSTSSTLSLEDSMTLSHQTKVLCPLKKAPIWGANNINAAIAKTLSQYQHRQFSSKRYTTPSRHVQPILITKNMYTLDCMNGDIGILESTSCEEKDIHSNEHIHITFKAGKSHSFPSILCPHRELGYAMTVHKSQGSEFSQVILALCGKMPIVTRELLYTAITRAKNRLWIVGEKEAIFSAVKKTSRRYSTLCQVIHKYYKKRSLNSRE